MRDKLNYLLKHFLISICKKYNPNNKLYQMLESGVPDYSLPDPLVLSNGTKVQDSDTWLNIRQNEIL